MDCWTRITRFYTQFMEDSSTVYLTDDISDSQERFGKATDEMAVKVVQNNQMTRAYFLCTAESE